MPFGGLVTGGILGGVGLINGLIGSNASGKAADAQVAAANKAAGVATAAEGTANAGVAKDLASATGVLGSTYQEELSRLAPYMQAGNEGLSGLEKGLAPGGSLIQGFNPNSVDMMTQDPGYQFRMSEGLKALDRSAAARGNATGGGQMKAITRYGQDYASNEYGNTYNRAFNAFESNQGNAFNRLMGLAGMGQSAANMGVSAGANYGNAMTGAYMGAAGMTSNNTMNMARLVGEDLTGAGNARASGYVGGANAWMNGLGNAANNFGTLMGKLYAPTP